MMPADCSVLRTPTILSNIRISWDYHPTFMLISGGSQGLSPTFEQAHVDSDLLTLASCILFKNNFLTSREREPYNNPQIQEKL